MTANSHSGRARHAACVAAALLACAPAAPGADEPNVVELRGAWVSGQRCVEANAIDAVLDRAETMNLNALFVLITSYDGTACYRTELLPRNPQMAADFDALKHFVAGGRKRGIQVHAWVINGSIRGGPKSKVVQAHPDWEAEDAGGHKTGWFDLCNPEVRAWQAKMMLEVATNYDVDSVHFDYIRFANPGMPMNKPTRKLAAKDGIDVEALCYPNLPAYGHFSGNPLAKPTTAKVLAAFDDGVPAIAVNSLGRGQVVLLNWSVRGFAPRAVSVAVGSAIRRLGVAAGGRVEVLDSAITAKRYRREGYRHAAAWVRDLGFEPKRIGDAGLAKLPAGAVIVLPNHYLMTPEQSAALLKHVQAGGGAVFLDGPVFALRKDTDAQKLLGFAHAGRYFRGERVLSLVETDDPDANWIPHDGRKIDTQAEQKAYRKWTQWRKDRITDVVADVSRQVRKARPSCMVTAAVFKDEVGSENVLQDWPRWVREGLLDYAVAMSYVPTADELDKHFAWYESIDPNLDRVLPAVGLFRIGGGEPPEKRCSLIGEQVAVCRKHSARGLVMFNIHSVDDATAELLGKRVFVGKARPWPARPRGAKGEAP
ncbi:MAG TPA: family 10 glycosylhydrolase [Phycisphaerae bacterium]|nr:family 10 glycosylhydrolase [Phycisphaerae bacterium]